MANELDSGSDRCCVRRCHRRRALVVWRRGRLFLLVYLLAALGGLRTRLQRSESDLNLLRMREGVDWRPPTIGFGPMQASAGEAALHGWNANDRRTWILWGLLLLGAGAVIAMVWRLLRVPG